MVRLPFLRPLFWVHDRAQGSREDARRGSIDAVRPWCLPDSYAKDRTISVESCCRMAGPGTWSG